MKTCGCLDFNDAYEGAKKAIGPRRFDALELTIYRALRDADAKDPDVMRWLNYTGYANLTVCPRCRVDDFTHVRGCPEAR